MLIQFHEKSVQWVRVYACGRTDMTNLLGAFRDVLTRRKPDTVNRVVVKWNVVAKWIGRRAPNQMPPPRPLVTAPCRTTVLLPLPPSFFLSFLAAYVTQPISFFWMLVIYSSILRQPFVGTLFYTLFLVTFKCLYSRILRTGLRAPL